MVKTLFCTLPLILLLDISGYAQTSSLPRELKRKIAWMERQGFPAEEYQWDNPAVNLNLQQALSSHDRAVKQQIGGYTLIGTGFVLTTVGGMGMMISALLAPLSEEDNHVLGYGIMTAVGGVAMGGGLTITLHGRRNSREAQDNIYSAVRLRSSQP